MNALSERQVTILRLLSEGLSDQTVAVRLGMSVHTVKWHNRQIYQILQVESRTQAVNWARKNLWTPDENRIRTNIPPVVTSFEGRGHLVATLNKMVLAARLTTIVGPPGIGKTRLALETAPTLLNQFSEGVWFVSLARCSEGSQILAEIANVLEIQAESDQPLVRTLQRKLYRGRRLLVLDNAEQVQNLAEPLQDLLSIPPLRLLVTSRHSLGVYGEQLLPVPPLDRESSLALYQARARSVQPLFQVDAVNQEDVAALCERLEGLPLSLELAAARVQLLPPEILLPRLDRRLDVLATRSGGTRTHSLRAAIDSSYSLLDAAEARLFRRLSIFSGSISLEAIEAVCDDEPSVLEITESLLNKNLIRRDQGAGGVRVALFETLKEYAADHLEPDELPELGRKHAQFYTKYATHWGPTIPTDRCPIGRKSLDLERRNLIQALDWSSKNQPALLAELTAALTEYWLVTARFTEGRHWTLLVVENQQNASSWARAKSLLHASAMFFYAQASNDINLGREWAEQSAELSRQSDNKVLLGWAIAVRACYDTLDTTSVVSGLARTAEAEELARGTGDLTCLSMVLLARGRLLYLAHRFEEAEQSQMACLELARKTQGVRMQILAQVHLGQIARKQGMWTKAESWLREALALVVDYTFDSFLCSTVVSLASGCLLERGDYGIAVRLLSAADANIRSVQAGPFVDSDGFHQRDLDRSKTLVEQDRWDRFWVDGQSLTLADAVRMINWPWSPLKSVPGR